MQDTEARNTFDVRCRRFGVSVLKLTDRFPKDSRGRHLADQLMRSGTSIGANLQEAQAAQSRADFIHKMQIALKEARESSYWLSLLLEASLYKDTDLQSLLDENQQIAAILAKSIMTAKANGRRIKRFTS